MDIFKFHILESGFDISEDDHQEERQQATKGFVQLGLDVEAIIGCAYPIFIFGGRNSAGQ